MYVNKQLVWLGGQRAASAPSERVPEQINHSWQVRDAGMKISWMTSQPAKILLLNQLRLPILFLLDKHLLGLQSRDYYFYYCSVLQPIREKHLGKKKVKKKKEISAFFLAGSSAVVCRWKWCAGNPNGMFLSFTHRLWRLCCRTKAEHLLQEIAAIVAGSPSLAKGQIEQVQ